MTYSIDFRKKVLKIRKAEGLSLEEVSKRFGVAKTSVFVWTKNLHPKAYRDKPCTKIDMNKLIEDIEKHPDAYQYERAERFAVSKAGIWYALKRLKVTYKKSAKTPQSQRRREIKIPR